MSTAAERLSGRPTWHEFRELQLSKAELVKLVQHNKWQLRCLVRPGGSPQRRTLRTWIRRLPLRRPHLRKQMRAMMSCRRGFNNPLEDPVTSCKKCREPGLSHFVSMCPLGPSATEADVRSPSALIDEVHCPCDITLVGPPSTFSTSIVAAIAESLSSRKFSAASACTRPAWSGKVDNVDSPQHRLVQEVMEASGRPLPVLVQVETANAVRRVSTLLGTTSWWPEAPLLPIDVGKESHLKLSACLPSPYGAEGDLDDDVVFCLPRHVCPGSLHPHMEAAAGQRLQSCAEACEAMGQALHAQVASEGRAASLTALAHFA